MMEDLINFENDEILNDKNQNKNENTHTQIDVNIINIGSQKEENYILINEEEDMLLIKKDIINDKIKNQNGNYNIKIKELYKGEDNEFYYYINKNILKEKYLKFNFDLDKNNDDIMIDNENEVEMNDLYTKTLLKHPRKVINGEIKKYSIFSWTGFYCCFKKNDFISLGFGISSYFKTIKLLIVFFFLISFINLITIFHYSKYSSIFENDHLLLKTTLGNTMSTYYNILIHHIILLHDNNTDNNQTLLLNCSNHLIGKFIYGINLPKYTDLNQLNNKIKELNNLNFTDFKVLNENEINQYNIMFEECFLKNNCHKNITIPISELSNVNLLYYECIDNNAFPKNYSQNQLKNIFHSTTIITLILILFLYFFYKKAISEDNKDYKKDKIIINNYTLILHDLDFNSNDYYQELNDLIFFLNNIIYNELINNDLFNVEEINVSSKNEINKNFYIFDISISNVNNKKIEKFKEIKSIQNKITNIKNDNYSIKQIIKNNMRDAYNSAHTLYIKFTDKNDEDKNEKSKDYLSQLLPLEQDLYEENKVKKDKKLRIIKNDLKEIINNITDEISELHVESKHKKYIDIYLTFKNPSISKLLYKIYKKSKIKRFFYYLCCNGRKIKKYYFKNKWFYFEISNTAPNDIQWENCYVYTSTKKKKRCISFLVSSFLIISVSISFLFLKNKTKNNKFLYILIILICQIVNLFSSILLEKLTKSEKYSTLTKNISSNITKYFWLNFIITGFSININMPSIHIFTYSNMTDYFEVINCVLTSMFISILSENGVELFKYLWNLFKRFIDSNFENGKKTKIKYKSKYDELYIGPEFPIDERYSSIYVYLSICLLYGVIAL